MARVIRADNRSPGVVPALVVSAHERARAIVESAERQAAEVRAEAEQQGRAEAQAALAAELLRLAQAHDRELSALHEASIEIAMQAAARLLGQELSQRPELIREVVAPLLGRVRRARNVTLRVHPDDLRALQPQLDALRERAALAGTLRVEPDASVTRGGCVVHSDVGSLDARVETQLTAIEQALKKGR